MSQIFGKDSNIYEYMIKFLYIMKERGGNMKKIDVFNQIGFTVDKKNNVAYGNVGAYKFIVNFLPQQRQYSIVATLKREGEDVLGPYLEGLPKASWLNWTHYQNNTLMINIKNENKLEVSDIEVLMRDISTFAQQNGYVQCCRHCGNEIPVDACLISGNADLACTSCIAQFASQQPPIKEVNLPLGIVGAVVGSLIGVVMWVVIYEIGFIAGITGFVMAVCCFKGYEMLGGRIDKKGIWICIAIAVIMLAAAEMITLGLEIHTSFSEYYEMSLSESFRLIPYMLEEGEITAAVIEDLLFGYVFMAAASFSYIKSVHRQVSTEGVVERLG